MLYFIIFIIGGIIGLSICSVLNANKTAEERERAEYAVKKAECERWYNEVFGG